MSEKTSTPYLLTRRNMLLLGVGTFFHISLTTPLYAAEKKAAGKLAPKKVPESKPKPPRFIMIDPGHGGKDPGAIGRKGTLEKNVTLDVSQRIVEALQGRADVIAKLTRNTDEFLPLKERVARAREAKADLFISIHADSAPTKLARGLSAYSLSSTGTDDFARELAKRENSVDEIGGVDLTDTEPDVAAILMDLTARHTRNAALKAKRFIVRGVSKEWRLLENPMRAAPFAVLRAPDVPSILIETGFLSNPQDEALLASSDKRQKIAQLLARELAGLIKSPPFA
jgi:N-acetylmuramoyl-L-alanine amidase